MAYEDLREKGLVEDVKPNFSAVSALIARSLKDLATARANASIDREWAYAIAYQGMSRAAKRRVYGPVDGTNNARLLRWLA